MAKYGYYKDGLVASIIARLTVNDDEMVAELWDYSKEKWVPTGLAWETIDDDRNNWNLGNEDGAKRAIADALEWLPDLPSTSKIQSDYAGAVRKKEK